MLAAFLPVSEGDLVLYKARAGWRCTSEDCGVSGSIFQRGYDPKPEGHRVIRNRNPGDECGESAQYGPGNPDWERDRLEEIDAA